MLENIKDLLEDKLGSSDGNENQLKFHCPYCDHHNKKLEVSIEKSVFHCWICDTSGSLSKLFKKLDIKSDILKSEKSLTEDLLAQAISELSETSTDNKSYSTIPNTYKPIRFADKTNNYKQAYSYLFKRKLKLYDMIKYNIHYDTEHYNILIPSYDSKGKVNYTFERSTNTSFKKNPSVSKKDIVFNELFIDWKEAITLVEGPFDAISAGNNSVPLLGSTLDDDYYLFKQLIKHKPCIYIALDYDARKKQEKIANLLYSYGLQVYTIDLPKDLDINELGMFKFNKYKQNAKLYTEMTTLLTALETL
jgi:hypothetical protein